MKKLIAIVLLAVGIANAGNIWVNCYNEAFYDIKNTQYLAESYYSTFRLGVGINIIDFYVSYLQYGFYKLATDQVPYIGFGIKKTWIIEDMFLEPTMDYHHDLVYNTNVFRIGVFFTKTIVHW